MSSKEKVCKRTKTFNCKLCDEEFDTTDGLKEHKKSTHTETKSLLCNICGKTFTKQRFLTDHTKSIHSEKRQFQCHLCEKSYIHDHKLQYHIKTFHKGIRDYICSICGKTFLSNNHLSTHIKIVHEEIREYKCDLCDRAFARSTTLLEHVKTVHKGIRNFQCNQCEKAFTQKANLQQHVKVVHSRKKDFICNVCGKQFGSKQDQDFHVRAIHEGAKDFKCDFCGNAFARKSQVQRHVYAMHSETKDYICSSCGKAFAAHQLLRRHAKKVHNIVMKPEPKPKVTKPTAINLSMSKENLKTKPPIKEVNEIGIPSEPTTISVMNKSLKKKPAIIATITNMTDNGSKTSKPSSSDLLIHKSNLTQKASNLSIKTENSKNTKSRDALSLLTNKEEDEIESIEIEVKPKVIRILPINKEDSSSNDAEWVESILDNYSSDSNDANDDMDVGVMKESISPDVTEDNALKVEKFDLSEGLEKFQDWKKKFLVMSNNQSEVKRNERSRASIQQLKLGNSLFSALSDETQQVVKSMGIAKDNFNAIIIAVEQHLSRSNNDSFLTHQLFSALRPQDQDIETFAASVQARASKAGYPAIILDKLMKDAFIFTLNDAEVTSKLLEVPSTTEAPMAFAKAVEIAALIYQSRKK